MQVFRDSEYGMSIRDMFCDIHYKKALDPGIFIILISDTGWLMS